MNNRRRTAIVFDFDGTIADTVPLIRLIYADMAAKKGWTSLTQTEYEKLRKGTLQEARKWAGIRWWQLPAVVRSAKRLLRLESEKVTFFPGIEALIRELDKRPDTDLYVLSRNTREAVATVLGRKGLSNELYILGRRRLFGSKSATLQWLSYHKGYKKKNIYMIGDEVRDIQAAKRARVKSVAVTWGLQDKSILHEYNPNTLVSSVDELKEYLYRIT